jgi:hypothetical protein
MITHYKESDMNRQMLRAALVTLVLCHLGLVFVNLAAMALLPFYQSWVVVVPLETFLILQVCTNSFDCPLTKIENSLRQTLGMPRIRGFVGHYMLSPSRKALRRRGILLPRRVAAVADDTVVCNNPISAS